MKALLAGLLLAVPFTFPASPVSSAPPASAPAARPSAPFDAVTFARALASGERAPTHPTPDARAIIVPHHWLAGSLIVSGLRDATAGRVIRRIVLVGPNHIGAGGAAFTTTSRSWSMPYGTVAADAAGISALRRAGAADSASVLEAEHSIAGLLPAIARLVPGATIVPLAIRSRVDEPSMKRMAAAIAQLMDSQTLVVASFDFSHYRSAAEAARRDAETIRAIRSFDAVRIARFGNEHLDSPCALAVLLRALDDAAASRFVLRDNRDSTHFGAAHYAPDITTYVTGYFA